jgi:aspartate 1-decarboxylase
MRSVLRSKLHNATVTDANPAYVGSITIDEALIDAAGFWPGEKVLVVSNDSGERLETYIIPASAGSGAIEMNGAAARCIHAGEEVIIMGFELSDQPIAATVLLLDSENGIDPAFNR